MARSPMSLAAILLFSGTNAWAQQDTVSQCVPDVAYEARGLPAGYAAAATVTSKGLGLSGGEHGRYAPVPNGPRVFVGMAANMFLWDGQRPLDNSLSRGLETRRHPHRYLKFDMTRPVPGSGSASLGVISDSLGRFHSFWTHVPERRVFINVVQVPVGDTVETDRVEMWLRHQGRQYVLLFGPWSAGQYSPRATYHGHGTTKAIIERPSFGTWIVKSRAGSIGRLWLMDDVQAPIDRGLYEFGFHVQFRCARQP